MTAKDSTVEKRVFEVLDFKWLQLIAYIPERWKFIIKENHEHAANHSSPPKTQRLKRVVTLDNVTTEIYYMLNSEVQNKPLLFTWKICLMTIVLTGQQCTCYHTLLRKLPKCHLFNTRSYKM